jgi:DNA-binding LacI/PurR family transcriptional regulator
MWLISYILLFTNEPLLITQGYVLQEDFDKQPIYRQIELRVKNYISSKQLPKHAKLPSENQLSAEYSVSVGTVRKALDNLIAEMVIYRRHGKGTFVAPRTRKKKVLFVPNCESISETSRNDYFDFFLGALSETNRLNLPCEPIIVEFHDFLESLDDLELLYPGLGGVIFFRGIQNCLDAEQTLRKAKIPFMYYGPNVYGETTERFPTLFHDESSIAVMAADYFKKKNYTKIAGIVTKGVTPKRSELFEQAAQLYDLTYKSFAIKDNLTEEFKPIFQQEIVGNYDALFCMTDQIAIFAIQFLERELGIKVPDDIAVMGVDNIPMAEMLLPSLTSIAINNYDNGQFCLKRFVQYLEDKQIFTEYCDLRLIERNST